LSFGFDMALLMLCFGFGHDFAFGKGSGYVLYLKKQKNFLYRNNSFAQGEVKR